MTEIIMSLLKKKRRSYNEIVSIFAEVVEDLNSLVNANTEEAKEVDKEVAVLISRKNVLIDEAKKAKQSIKNISSLV